VAAQCGVKETAAVANVRGDMVEAGMMMVKRLKEEMTLRCCWPLMVTRQSDGIEKQIFEYERKMEMEGEERGKKSRRRLTRCFNLRNQGGFLRSWLVLRDSARRKGALQHVLYQKDRKTQ